VRSTLGSVHSFDCRRRATKFPSNARSVEGKNKSEEQEEGVEAVERVGTSQKASLNKICSVPVVRWRCEANKPVEVSTTLKRGSEKGGLEGNQIKNKKMSS